MNTSTTTSKKKPVKFYRALSSNSSIDSTTSRYLNLIEGNYDSNNFNIFIVSAELPALVSILKRFSIYLLVGSLLASCYIYSLSSFFTLFSDTYLNNFFIGSPDVFDLGEFFATTYSSHQVQTDSIVIVFLVLKTLLFFHLILNVFLLSFYYLNSFFLVQKYNSVQKFRGNDLIPDSLDFAQDGIKRVMWKI